MHHLMENTTWGTYLTQPDLSFFKTDARFRIYSVRYNDIFRKQRLCRMENMVPYGAPYVDLNYNGYFDEFIDKPGVEDAIQTIFVYLTDANPGSHHNFRRIQRRGTKPLFAEVSLTAWGYDFGSFGRYSVSEMENNQ